MRKDKEYERILQSEREHVTQKLKETDDEFDFEASIYEYSTIVGLLDAVATYGDYSNKERLMRIQAILEVFREWQNRDREHEW